MSKNYIYTVGYTLFQKENKIDIDYLFQTLKAYGVQYLIDVRSVPFSKQFPQCNSDNLKEAGKIFGVPYINMPELGAKPNSSDLYSKASDIFFEEIFPIAKSNRPEKTELFASDEIVDFQKFRCDEFFISGLRRIEKAYEHGYTLCLMCSESKPVSCHRYFLISKALESRFSEWLEIKHIVKKENGELCTISNKDLKELLTKHIISRDIIKKLGVLNNALFGVSCLDNYFGDTYQEKIEDFCDRYWNIIHGWKKATHQ